MRRAEDFRYAQELSNLEMAIYAYKVKYKDFPPDFTDAQDPNLTLQDFLHKTVAGRHILMAFPRIDRNELEVIWKFARNIDAAGALVFWLGGLSKDPTHPFTGQGGPLEKTGNGLRWRLLQDRTEPLFDFDESRVQINVPSLVHTPPKLLAFYLPPNNPTPYVYFDSRTYEFLDANDSIHFSGWRPRDVPDYYTVVRPYKSDIDDNPNGPWHRHKHWANRNTFQLICAGHDGEFGPVLHNSNVVLTRFPSLQVLSGGAVPTNYLEGQLDNLTNFSEGQTLENAKP
jgi:hypothetical protein